MPEPTRNKGRGLIKKWMSMYKNLFLALSLFYCKINLYIVFKKVMVRFKPPGKSVGYGCYVNTPFGPLVL